MEEETELIASMSPRKRLKKEVCSKKEKDLDIETELSSDIPPVTSQSQVGKYEEPPKICLSEKVVNSSTMDRTGTTKNDDESTILNKDEYVVLPKRKLSRISLEAIFYPKFENENRNDQFIRKEMLSKVTASLGYIEVTLKHSGSLILWSGEDRYYSKNSADNVFTGVGEIMLRQHFAWSWKHQNENKTNPSNVNYESYDQDEIHYNECSKFVTQRNLTLSFEVVTAVLGHHGAIPKRDYLVLTAVADRKTAEFMSSPDLISFAQKFRLPHNDTWLFQSPECATKLFQLYETSRENGLTDTVIPALTQFADGGHVQSIYPHADFQGNILEGIVIRYVPYDMDQSKLSDEISHSKMIEEKQNKFKQLASQSTFIYNSIPKEEISDYNLSKPTILSCSIRDIMKKHFFDSEAFEREIQNILQANDHHERRILSRAKVSSNHSFKQTGDVDEIVHLPSFIRQNLDVTNENIDDQTKKLFTLLEHLNCFGRQVTYKLFREKTKRPRFNSAKERWLCIIHVHHDDTFRKYFKQKKQDDMTLFRGFCINLIFDEDDVSCDSNGLEGNKTHQPFCKHSNLSENCNQWNREPLLLKMKFLPYMVRTFICRNGLNILSRSGVKVFKDWAQGQMRKWNISDQNSLKWITFFDSWAVYAKKVLDSFKCKEPPTKFSHNIKEIPLNQKTYLFHLDHFSDLFDQGNRWDNQPNNKRPTFRGALFIIGLNEVNTKKLLEVFAEKLNILKIVNDAKSVREVNFLESLSSLGGGFGFYGTVEKSLKMMKRYSKKYGDTMFVVSYGLALNEIDQSVENPNERIKFKNMASVLKNLKCSIFLSLPLFPCLEKELLMKLDNPSSDSVNDEIHAPIFNIAKTIEKASESLPTSDDRRGLIIFFPCIPGSGKSTLCNYITPERLLGKRKEMNTCDSKKNSKTYQECSDRILVISCGDKVKGKYWRSVEVEKLEHPSSIYIADKNVPPVSWSEVANICLKTNGNFIPVIPSGQAISTTTVKFRCIVGNDLEVERTHQYPFSLPFLAICMERVISREKCSHSGRLDAGTKDACIVVAKFFSFYRNITAENFREKLFEKFHEVGIKSKPAIVEFPFLSNHDKTINLPEQLENALLDVINYHYAISHKLNMSGCKDGFTANAIENRLRSLLLKHKEDLRKLSSPELDSKQVFLSHVARAINELDTEPHDKFEFFPEKNKMALNSLLGHSSNIKIVSIDVEFAKVHNIIDTIRKIDNSLEKYFASKFDEENLIIKKTHVTLAHRQDMSQEEMREKYESLQGKSIDIFVSSFLFNEKIAAFSASCDCTTSDGHSVPAPQKSFPHITIFCGKGVESKEANQLPELVENGCAEKFCFEETFRIQGTLSFWK